MTLLQSIRLGTFSERDAEDWKKLDTCRFTYASKKEKKGKEDISIHPLIFRPEIRCLSQYHACPELLLETRGRRDKHLQRDSIHCSSQVCISEIPGLSWDPSNNVFIVEKSSSAVAEG